MFIKQVSKCVSEMISVLPPCPQLVLGFVATSLFYVVDRQLCGKVKRFLLQKVGTLDVNNLFRNNF